MIKTFSLLSRLLLLVCITFYSPVAMAGMVSDGAVFVMEICAGDMVKTIRLDADGNPVETNEDCLECLTCCHTPVVWLDASPGARLSRILFRMPTDISSSSSPVFLKSFTRPIPRGPPAMHLSVLTMPDWIETDPAVFGNIKRSGGRPLLKDASA